MNILFVDTQAINNCSKFKKYLDNKFGFYLNISDDKKYGMLKISDDERKVNLSLLKYIIKYWCKKNKIYIVLSKYAEQIEYIKDLIDNAITDKIFVTEQNNLFKNDIKYIDKYIKRKKLERKDIRVLFITDSINNIEIKRKIEYFLQLYKVVDILLTDYNNYEDVKEYIDNINKKEGSAIEIVDKKRKIDYNVLLMFTNTVELKYTKDSFILDYNNSDLDVESSTFLIYKNNKKMYDKIFNELNMDISRFKKTKLGKLYIHASRLMLDK